MRKSTDEQADRGEPAGEERPRPVDEQLQIELESLGHRPAFIANNGFPGQEIGPQN
jgi:hypothetical protein